MNARVLLLTILSLLVLLLSPSVQDSLFDSFDGSSHSDVVGLSSRSLPSSSKPPLNLGASLSSSSSSRSSESSYSPKSSFSVPTNHNIQRTGRKPPDDRSSPRLSTRVSVGTSVGWKSNLPPEQRNELPYKIRSIRSSELLGSNSFQLPEFSETYETSTSYNIEGDNKTTKVTTYTNIFKNVTTKRFNIPDLQAPENSSVQDLFGFFNQYLQGSSPEIQSALDKALQSFNQSPQSDFPELITSSNIPNYQNYNTPVIPRGSLNDSGPPELLTEASTETSITWNVPSEQIKEVNTEFGNNQNTNNEGISDSPPYINQYVSHASNDLGNRKPDESFAKLIMLNETQCRDDEFRCGSNECLPYSLKCDNKVDCRDSSDEVLCTIENNQKNGCVLPEYPEGGRYKLEECKEPCNKRPGDKVPKASILTYSCRNNSVLKGSTISVCTGDDWSEPPSCFKICPALSSTSVNIFCSYEGETVSCTKYILPGTRARLSCKSSYKLPLTNDPAYREITCLDDGLWDRRIFRCLPECGTSIALGTPLIVRGFKSKVGTFPWHVGIYKKKEDMRYQQICSGSLINNNLVISAAHCFYNEITNKLNDVSNYAVAAGKYFRAWTREEQYSQKSMVEKIDTSGRYLGARGNYAEDIALLKLETPFELTTLVRPICLDWDNIFEREQLRAGKSGKVVGWGKDIRGEPTQFLNEIDMPYVPYHQCVSAVPANFRGYLTSDKFCAGHLNGSSVCDGDSGGGLCFEKDGIWYLRGIVSVSPAKGDSCDYNSYVGFTYFSHFRDWIREAYINS